MNHTMKQEQIKEVVEQIEMPEGMSGELLSGCLQRKHRGGILFRHARLAYAVTCAIAILMVSMPVYAAYDLYQTKNVDIFFYPNLSQEQIEYIGENLTAIEGISSVKFIGAAEAWENFAQEYLTEELSASFTENPLADSASYRVTIGLEADSQTIINQILQLDGVRHAGTLKEVALQKQAQARIYFEPGTTLEHMEQVGAALNLMEEVKSVTFTNADEAWDSFKKEYLTEDLTASFTENPLKDCANYYIIIDSDTDIQAVINKIDGMEGVRKVNHS